MALYRLLLLVLLPALLVRLFWRAWRGAEPWDMLAERLGYGTPVPGRIWLHAASNGELVSARPLIDALFAARPDLTLLVTTNTVTGRDLARSWSRDWAGSRIIARAAPLDGRGCLRRFLSRHQPVALLGIENELWPNRFTLCHRAGIPVVVAGARMSARSARRWQKVGLGAGLMTAVTALSAQDVASQDAFLSLGLPVTRLLPMINLKTAVAAPAATEGTGWPRAETILAASTHEGEEELVLAAFARVHALRPDRRLILAPRHPRRADAIARMIAATGLSYTTRSRHDGMTAPILLADTMGEMANWYSAAGICFVGGSLVAKGGHTPFEPVAYGCAVLHGPSIDNHRAAFEALDAAGGAVPVRTREDLERGFQMSAPDQNRIAQLAQAAVSQVSQSGDSAALARLILGQLTGQSIKNA